MRFAAHAAAAVALSFAQTTSAFTWPNATERVEKALSSNDASARRQAAQRLLDLPRSVATRLTKKALSDADDDVRLAAAGAALQLRIDGAGALVTPWLNDPERRLRLAAAEILRLSPTERAVAPLGRVLGDPDSGVRVAAAEALGASGTGDAVLPLLGHLDDSVPKVRTAVIDALARLGDPRAVVPLIGKIRDPRPEARRSVARALGELGDARATSALVLALRDLDENVRVAALVALGRLGSDRSVLAISSVLEGEQRPDARAAAMDALAEIGSDRALDVLIESLDSKSSRDRLSAGRALGRVGTRAVSRLERCLVGQPTPRQAEGCVRALGSMRGAVKPRAIVAALGRGIVRSRPALAALAQLRSSAALPTVLEYLFDADPFVRREAIEAAFELLDPKKPDGRAVEPIARALDSARTNRAERAALASLMGRTGSPRAVKALIPLAREHDDLALRLAAIQALGQIGPAGQDDPLLEALDAEQGSVRLAAAVALRRSASGQTALVLLDRLDRAAEQDRAAIAIGLAGSLARSNEAAVASRARERLNKSRGAERDVLLEALGHLPGPLATRELSRFLEGGSSVADRAKVAESLASHDEARALLAKLAADADGSVRANAVWGLGQVGKVAEVSVLARALSDRDVAVAGNAAGALGRIGKRAGKKVVADRLCAALVDGRSYVRANAAAALALAKARCADGARARSLVERDPSPVVRGSAARLIAEVRSSSTDADRRALEHCAARDVDGRAAAACASTGPTDEIHGTESISVFVVPVGHDSPAPRAPFALVLADGLMRLGLTDRRGAVFERLAPRGTVRLTIPAPLAR